MAAVFSAWTKRLYCQMMKLFAHKAPWYISGLAFECTGCGQCCAGPEEGYVWVTQEEIAAIARHVGLSQAEIRRKYVRKVSGRFSLTERKNNRDCIFLSFQPDGGMRCRIYPVRPMQCRTWPFWPGNLKSQETWSMAASRCQGINRGTLHAYDRIEAQRKATDSGT